VFHPKQFVIPLKHYLRFGKPTPTRRLKRPDGLRGEDAYVLTVPAAENSVSTAAKPPLARYMSCWLAIKEEDFYFIREIVERTRSMLAADLDHAHSTEGKAMLQQKS
jgi:hypothetical protein